jgi:hypothetical protein
MKKKLLTSFVISTLLFGIADAQQKKKHEEIMIEWPSEYNWKVIQRTNTSGKAQVMIIPGNENPQTASIIGTIAGYFSVDAGSPDSVIAMYRSLIDSGTVLTVLERGDSVEMRGGPKQADSKERCWVIFKTETSVTNKYPIAESDLYYVRQGEYALYENYVAIKKPSLDAEFTERWVKVFKTAKIIIH